MTKEINNADHWTRQSAIKIIEHVIEPLLKKGLNGEKYYSAEDQIAFIIHKEHSYAKSTKSTGSKKIPNKPRDNGKSCKVQKRDSTDSKRVEKRTVHQLENKKPHRKIGSTLRTHHKALPALQ